MKVFTFSMPWGGVIGLGVYRIAKGRRIVLWVGYKSVALDII